MSTLYARIVTEFDNHRAGAGDPPTLPTPRPAHATYSNRPECLTCTPEEADANAHEQVLLGIETVRERFADIAADLDRKLANARMRLANASLHAGFRQQAANETEARVAERRKAIVAEYGDTASIANPPLVVTGPEGVSEQAAAAACREYAKQDGNFWLGLFWGLVATFAIVTVCVSIGWGLYWLIWR